VRRSIKSFYVSTRVFVRSRIGPSPQDAVRDLRQPEIGNADCSALPVVLTFLIVPSLRDTV